MRALVTGSRDWPDGEMFAVHAMLHGLEAQAAAAFEDLTIVVGDCPTGVDKITRDWCDLFDIACDRHDADWDRYGKDAGPTRNQAMVDSGADLCLAFFNGKPRHNSGTADCRGRAHKAGIPIYTIERWRW